MIAAALGIALLAGGGAPASARTVAVIVTGGPPDAVDSCQRTLEARLASRARVRSAAEIAATLAVTAELPPFDPAIAARVRALRDEAERAYYEDHLDQTLSRLDEALALLDADDAAPSADRAQVQLWRAAALLGQSLRDEAAGAARNALSLDPDAKIDLGALPPSVGRLVEEARAKLAAPIAVSIDGLPPGAAIFIDERPQDPAHLAVIPGVHLFTIRAPGFRPFRRRLEAAEPVHFPLVIALEPAVESGIALIAARGSATAEESRRLARLATRLRADDLVIVSAGRSGSRAVIARVEGAGARVTAVEGDTSIPRALAESVAGALDRRAARDDRGMLVRVSMIAARSTRSVSGGASFHTGLTGAGARLDAEARRGRVLGGGGVTLIDFAPTDVRVRLPDGSVATAPGGRSFEGDAFAGARLAGDPDRIALDLLAVLAATSLQANDVRNVSGPLGLLPSETIFEGSLAARGRGRIGNVALGVEAGAAAGMLTEKPPDTTGMKPEMSASPFAALEVRWEGNRSWSLGLMGRLQTRTTKFSGPARVTWNAPIADAGVHETLTSVSATVSRRF